MVVFEGLLLVALKGSPTRAISRRSCVEREDGARNCTVYPGQTGLKTGPIMVLNFSNPLEPQNSYTWKRAALIQPSGAGSRGGSEVECWFLGCVFFWVPRNRSHQHGFDFRVGVPLQPQKGRTLKKDTLLHHFTIVCRKPFGKPPYTSLPLFLRHTHFSVLLLKSLGLGHCLPIKKKADKQNQKMGVVSKLGAKVSSASRWGSFPRAPSYSR